MSGDAAFEQAATRLSEVRDRIDRAAERAGRDPREIQLIAVSKQFPAAAVAAMVDAGQVVFGENRVQEGTTKIPEVDGLRPDARITWRLIGHLQRNKVRAALEVFDTVDSVDSVRLIEALDREAERRDRVVPVLIQFNCSGEAAKSGFETGEVEAVAEALREAEYLDPRGCMTIGPLTGGEEAARAAFQRLHGLRDRLEQLLGGRLPDLSMGMSGDLEAGISEGATHVRVGTALFGPRG